MQTKPASTTAPTSTEKILDWMGPLFLATLWISTIFISRSSPATIPTHFGPDGRPDKYGSNETLWIIPAIASFLYFLLTIIGRYPQSFNYLKRITAENAAQQYQAATTLLKCLKVSLLLLFIIIQWATYFTVQGKIGGLGWWFPAAIFILVFIPIIVYLYKAWKIE